MKKIFLLLIVFSFCIIAKAQPPSYIPTNGLVGWWPFNGNANDESGNGYNGTVTGAVLTADRFSNANSAYDFETDGNVFSQSGDNIEIPYNVTQLNTNELTVCAWINPESYYWTGNSIHYSMIIGSSNICAPGTNDLRFGLEDDEDFSIYLNSGIADLSPSGIINLSEWQFVVASIDNYVCKLYLNGQLLQTYNNSSLPVYSGCLNIGQHHQGNGYWYYFDGILDDIGLWNRALSDAEIMQIYTGCGTIITSQPQNKTVKAGDNTWFSITASGSGLSFQWQQDTGTGFFNVLNNPPYSGVTNDTLTVSNVTATHDSISFRCVVSDGICTDTSSSAMLLISTKQLVFSQVLLINSLQTVPANKAWKIESVVSSSDDLPSFAGCGNITSASTKILINGTPTYIHTTYHAHGSGTCSTGQGQSLMSADISQLPFWLPEGATIAPSTNVNYISVIEFSTILP